MYFKNFPQFIYDFNINGQVKDVVISDITRNVRIRNEILANIALYDEYDVKDGETPEIIAEKVYGSANYHWIVMLTNERYDYIADFPLTYTALVKYVEDKYGVDNVNATHHWVNEKGFIVNSDEPGATPISNLHHEERVNESKRRIKIISPQIISKILSQYKDLV
jgi:hypothetical protein